MGCKLYVAYEDGSCREREVMHHEIDHIQAVAEESPKQYIVQVELEHNNIVIYQYKRKLERVY